MTSFDIAQAFGVKGQTVIVTGAAGHLGRGIAEAFAQNGARVVLSDLPSEKLDAHTRALRDKGYEVISVAADLTSDAELGHLISATTEKYGPLNALINNGGVPHSGPLFSEPPEAFDRMYHTNVRSIWLLTRHAVGAMAPGGGSIVNMASVNGHHATFYCPLYTGTKAAVLAMTRELATELAPQSVRVNSISPGAIPRDLRSWSSTVSRLAEPWRSQFKQDLEALDAVPRYSTGQPLPITGLPYDIAMGCIYLCSPAARFITGADIVIDGGKLVEIPDRESRFLDRAKSPHAMMRNRLRELPAEAWIEKPRWLLPHHSATPQKR
jgi:NAD(P)-dependent dehydrogenase (short-subunit alcohol dehydrogenase family)